MDSHPEKNRVTRKQATDEAQITRIRISRCQETDWPAIWPLLRATFETGDTYAFAPQSTESEIHAAWMQAPRATYLVREGGSSDGRVLGTYFIKANQPGLGSHVCNCGYVVAPEAQGQGLASAMCEHSQREGGGHGVSRDAVQPGGVNQ